MESVNFCLSNLRWVNLQKQACWSVRPFVSMFFYLDVAGEPSSDFYLCIRINIYKFYKVTSCSWAGLALAKCGSRWVNRTVCLKLLNFCMKLNIHNDWKVTRARLMKKQFDRVFFWNVSLLQSWSNLADFVW